jgi:hypothetical protein
MMQKELLAKKDYASVGEEISHELAADFVKAYEQANPAAVRGYNIGRNIIDAILAQPGCVGLRFYNAINEANQPTLVYVGIDVEGKDLVKRIVITNSGDLAAADGILADRAGNIWPTGIGR